MTDYFVKRVVGLPGETVGFNSGRISINRKLLVESYINRQQIYEYTEHIILGKDEFFVMGDNRGYSEDSRDIGPVKLNDITGRVDMIIFPKEHRTQLANPFTET